MSNNVQMPCRWQGFSIACLCPLEFVLKNSGGFRAEDFILVKTWKNEKKERIGKEKNEV